MLSELEALVAKHGADRVASVIPPAYAPYVPFVWALNARPNQLPPPGAWARWLVLAGRGFGKTRMGVEFVLAKMRAHPGCRIALVGRTAADVYGTMLFGESGLMSKAHPSDGLVHNAQHRTVTHANGSFVTTYSADEPKQLRGPQHHYGWADELASWQYPEAWDQLQFGLRLGDAPQAVITTTPLPTTQIRELLKDPDCVVTRGSTYDNRKNLAASFFTSVIKKYEGTRTGQQELMGEVLDDVPGALWKGGWVKHLPAPTGGERERVVIGVDPATTHGEDSDLTGIVVACTDSKGGYHVLHDATQRSSPDAWAKEVVRLWRAYGADAVVVETNQGGKLLRDLLIKLDAGVPIVEVHAKVGKRLRAEPIAMLYEQGRVSHADFFVALEDQMTTHSFDGSKGSPDRIDALVYALTELAKADVAVPTQDPELSPERQLEQQHIENMRRSLEESGKW